MRHALVKNASGFVENVVEIEPGDGSIDAEGFSHVPSDTAAIGDVWDGANFLKPDNVQGADNG